MRHWPLFDLRLRTPRLELRVPSLADLDELAERAFEGVHDPDEMPFAFPWTDAEPAERARSVPKWHWSQWSSWTPEKWSCDFVTVRREEGVVLGTQAVGATNFATVREVGTGSWLGQAYHGYGYGTEMRAAVLHFAFAGLRAEYARSGGFVDNPASLAISRKLGYEADGTEVNARRGERGVTQRLLLSKAAWERHRTVEVEVDGLEPCLPLFGLDPTSPTTP